jgi:hypothetical protein
MKNKTNKKRRRGKKFSKKRGGWKVNNSKKRGGWKVNNSKGQTTRQIGKNSNSIVEGISNKGSVIPTSIVKSISNKGSENPTSIVKSISNKGSVIPKSIISTSSVNSSLNNHAKLPILTKDLSEFQIDFSKYISTPADLNGEMPSKANNYGNLNLPQILPEDMNKITRFNEWMQTQSSEYTQHGEYSQRGGDGNYFFPMSDGVNFSLLELKLALLYFENTVCPTHDFKMFVLFERVPYNFQDRANTYIVNLSTGSGLRVQVCLFRNQPINETNTNKVYARQLIRGTTYTDVTTTLSSPEYFLNFTMPLIEGVGQGVDHFSTNIEEFALQVLNYDNIPIASYYIIDTALNNFIRETITMENVPIHAEYISNFLITDPDVEAFRCYSLSWDSLINTRCYNPELDSLHIQNRNLIFYDALPNERKYIAPNDGNPDSTLTYLKREADYKISRYEQIMYCKS